jgi:hypothetical protein
MLERCLPVITAIAVAFSSALAQEARVDIGQAICGLSEGAEADGGGDAMTRQTSKMLCVFRPSNNGLEGAGASLTHAIVGNDMIIHAGVRIGQDGFGFAMSPQRGTPRYPRSVASSSDDPTLRSDDAKSADHDVVGNLHEIVDLGALPRWLCLIMRPGRPWSLPRSQHYRRAQGENLGGP